MYDPVAIPHSKETVTLSAVPFEVRSPLRVAEVVSILAASFVVTVGVSFVAKAPFRAGVDVTEEPDAAIPASVPGPDIQPPERSSNARTAREIARPSARFRSVVELSDFFSQELGFLIIV